MMFVSRPMDLWKRTFISSLCSCEKLLFPPFKLRVASSSLVLNVLFCCSNHQGDAFFFFLLLSLSSSVLQWHYEDGNFFLGYIQPNWIFYAWYCLESYFSKYLRLNIPFDASRYLVYLWNEWYYNCVVKAALNIVL